MPYVQENYREKAEKDNKYRQKGKGAAYHEALKTIH
jgi:hypothetical protein